MTQSRAGLRGLLSRLTKRQFHPFPDMYLRVDKVDAVLDALKGIQENINICVNETRYLSSTALPEIQSVIGQRIGDCEEKIERLGALGNQRSTKTTAVGRVSMDYLAIAATVPGWREGEEAAAVYGASYSRPDDAVLIEVGSFLGRSTILLAGARKLRGSGKVYCIDPFDCSGDDFSVPFYEKILAEQGGGSLREQFENNIDQAGLTEWVRVLPRRAVDAAMEWRAPVDLLLLDGDQSPQGAREAFDAWLPHLKSGGVLIMGNSTPRNYAKTHDGNWLISTELVYPQFIDLRRVGTATIAIKA